MVNTMALLVGERPKFKIGEDEVYIMEIASAGNAHFI